MYQITGRDAKKMQKYLSQNLFALKRNHQDISETYNRGNLTIALTGPTVTQNTILRHIQSEYQLQTKPHTVYLACHKYFFQWSYGPKKDPVHNAADYTIDPFGLEPGHVLYICDNNWLDKKNEKTKPQAEDDIKIHKRTPWK